MIPFLAYSPKTPAGGSRSTMLVTLSGLALCLLLPHEVSPSHHTNLCATSGLCCRHRDSGCVVQHVLKNHSVDTTALPCYCDHACLRLEDCCPDYRDFCDVRDCMVSEWGPWSPCPDLSEEDPVQSSAEMAHLCAKGIVERRRVILHEALNGGRKCPRLEQKKQCRPLLCPRHKDERYGELPKEKPSDLDTGRAVADSMHYIAQGFHSPRKDLKVIPGCIEMVLVRASHGCHTHGDKLKTGSRICIQCPVTGDGGRGQPGHLCHRLTSSDQEISSRRFRLSNHCHGRLALLADRRGEECACDTDMQFRNGANAYPILAAIEIYINTACLLPFQIGTIKHQSAPAFFSFQPRYRNIGL